MLFESDFLNPSSTLLETDAGITNLHADSNCQWSKGPISVRLNQGKILLSSPCEKPIRLQLSWKTSCTVGTRFLNDHWERGYGICIGGLRK